MTFRSDLKTRRLAVVVWWDPWAEWHYYWNLDATLIDTEFAALRLQSRALEVLYRFDIEVSCGTNDVLTLLDERRPYMAHYAEVYRRTREPVQLP